MGTVVTLVFAVIVLGLRFDLAAVDWPLLVASLVMGLVPIIALGVLLAAICLQTRQESWSYPDAFAGALFLVSGVVFPLAVLPYAAPGARPGQPDHLVAGRRAPRGRPGRPVVHRRRRAPCGPLSPEPLRRTQRRSCVALFVTGALVTLAAIAIFRSSERRARDLGLLDRTTGS